ncbi:MAG: PBP1A family penicillin-binding protein [Myxococcales bacterium]|nr:PBP1A family penicillin-binding protein [Myxococcales bacterium]
MSTRNDLPASQAPHPKKKRKRFSILRFLVLLVFLGGASGGALGYWGYREFEKDLPDRWSALIDYRPKKASRVYSADGEMIGEFFLEKRVVVPYDKIPKHVVRAFVAAEDNRFFDHHGIDPVGIFRAAIANLKAGRVVQGGSTITQQVAKLMLVGNERNMFRKIREAILAHKIEARLSKEQILTLYLNHVYLGHGAYGVQAAAEIYFGKDVQDLTIAEAGLIGGLPKAPTEDSPFSAFQRAKDRQRYVLAQMVENGFITAAEGDEARREPIAIISRDAPLNHVAAPHFVEFIRKYVQKNYGGGRVYSQGMNIHTTLSMRQQRAAEVAVRRGLEDLDKRLGFRGPVGHVEGTKWEEFLAAGPRAYVGPREDVRSASGAVFADKAYLGLIESFNPGARGPARGKGKGILIAVGADHIRLVDEDAARIEHWNSRKGQRVSLGDLVPVKVVTVEVKRGKRTALEVRMATLAQRPDVESALVAVDPATGWLTAMVGGYDYDLSQFNRAVQAKRQAGSSIKPYIYTAALEKGYTELTTVYDAPVAIRTAAGVWRPHNYKDEFLGPVTLRTALAKSLNTVSVRLVESVGVDNTIEVFRRFGLTSPIPRHISIALGVPELSPMEAAYAQATFPAGGLEVKPIFITSIVDTDGQVIEENRVAPQAARKRRIAPDTAFVMVDLMKNVVQNGTGRKALALGRPSAGKTGTSNDFRDAWYVGYTPELLAVVWVGRDDFKQIGHDTTGGATALPIWLDFMQHGHPETPIKDFAPPPGVMFVRATSDKGLPCGPAAPNSVLIPFQRGTLPREFAQSSRKAEFTDKLF